MASIICYYSHMRVEQLMIARHLMRLGAYLEREGGRELSQIGLTHQQFLVLTRISEQGSVSQKDLCDKLLYEKSNVSKIIKKLLAFALIDISSDPEDARRQVIRINDQGSLAVQKGKRIVSAWVEQWLKRLTDGENTEIVSMLIKLNSLVR